MAQCGEIGERIRAARKNELCRHVRRTPGLVANTTFGCFEWPVRSVSDLRFVAVVEFAYEMELRILSSGEVVRSGVGLPQFARSTLLQRSDALSRSPDNLPEIIV